MLGRWGRCRAFKDSSPAFARRACFRALSLIQKALAAIKKIANQSSTCCSGAWWLGPLRLGGVHQQGGLVHVTCEHGRVCLERMGNAVFDQRALVGRGFFEYPIGNLRFFACALALDTPAKNQKLPTGCSKNPRPTSAH